ncbi:hypothetical protein WJX72_010214 [[Myrmecia] bisecta]|uniref:non-specific serine/threonine protein kinase n=1 Tax=[Myrmecia] bisecta TaxID=41462 RepID=A0AAW1PB58_9CHLO
MASTTEQQLQSLIRIATRPSPSEALEARLSALHSLSDLLKTPEGAQAVQPRLLALWPLMLQLLGDSQAAIRQSAAPLVGLLGALAVSPRAAQRAPKAGGKPGAPPGLLFDWALPLLGGQQTRPLDLGSQYWMLVALKEGLAAVDDKTLARYAYAVVDVCQQLLESEATSVHILPPLFAVVMQVARHQHALQARFQDLVDLLLGWALDEAFPDNIRHLLADTFASFRPAWQARGPFAQSLVANLAADLAELASWPDSLATTEVRRFVALLSSVAAVVRAAASPEFASFLAGTLPGLVASIKAFHLLVRRDAALLTNPGSFAQEVCRYLDMLVMVAASRMQSVDAARQPACIAWQLGGTSPLAQLRTSTDAPVAVDHAEQAQQAEHASRRQHKAFLEALWQRMLPLCLPQGALSSVAAVWLPALSLERTIAAALNRLEGNDNNLESAALAAQQAHLLRKAGPVLLTPGGSRGAADAGWALRLYHSCPLLPELQSEGDDRPITSPVRAAWWAIQEAARHCTAARMRTHFGGPTQSFAALERALQGILARLMPKHKADPGNVTRPLSLEPTWLFQEFMLALEKNIFNAFEGSCLRPAPPSAATAFFAGNRKVCEDWFMRMRPLLMRTAAASEHHQATLHHALARLAELRSQMRILAANAAPAASAPAAAAALGAGTALLDGSPSGGPAAPVGAVALTPVAATSASAAVQTGRGGWGQAQDTVKAENKKGARQFLAGTLAWMDGLRLQAAGSYEAAARQHVQAAEAAAGGRLPAAPEDVAFMTARSCEAYAAVGDWEGLQTWLARLEALKEHSKGDDAAKLPAAAMTPAIDVSNRYLAAASLDRGDLQTAHGLLALSSWDPRLDPGDGGSSAAPGSAKGLFNLELSREVREATNGGDVSPWLQLLRVHQTLNPDPAGPSSRHAPLVLRIARMATSSGNYGLAGRLLSGLFSVDSMQAVGGAPVNLEMLSGLHASGPTADASRQASGMAIADERWREASVLVEVEKLRTACALGALAEAAAAGQLWNMLLPHASGASAQAPLASSLARSAAFLQLAAWLTPSTASAPARATPTQIGDDRGESAIQQLLPYYERGLAEVPAAAWGAVTPQLFAQLLHPDQAVRQLAQRLLEALEMVSPAQVLYPALVEERQALADGHAVGAELATIVADCRRRQPAVVQQLTLMMDEMQRLTVLQAEQWHAILAELQVDVSRRLITLQAEAARCAARAELDTQAKQQIMSDRYATVMAPAALTLQRHMRALQATPPQSPHEQDFQKRFLQPLRAAAEAFTAPDQHSVLRPEAAWKPLQRLASSIGQYISNPSMKLRSISPALQALSDSRIPMPGVDFQAPAHRTATLSSLEAALRSASGSGSGSGSGSADQPPPAGPHQISDGGVVTVAKVDAHVGVLATKTRPKKLRLTGSDGRVYPFLLKGREDLRMDERLMQFLRVANSILRTDPASQLRALHARHFTVTPLGPRTGLIQWLDNTVPLYGVYKAWQKRAATRKAGQAPAAQPGEVAKPGMAANKAPKVLHATELFYSRLVPALEEAGLGRLASRRDWPMDVLKKVLVELMRETPRQLLAREMWAGSASAAGWWAFQRRYSKSTAVMSMVGYLLGLGDRHLDNILLDARTADVVHIDFNIIFDKGLKLSVPEIVPFRLTQTIQAALGLTGVEGAFRSDCEAVLHSLRSQSDTLTGLLEAIVNDPLVDWAVDREHHAARQDMELAVSLNLFTSRMSEMGPRVQHNLQHLASALQTTATLLARFLPLHQDTAHAAQVARTAHEQAQAAQAALTSASNEAASTRSRLARALEATEQLQPQVTSLSAALQPTVRECRVWAERHAHTVGSFQQQTPGELTLPLEYWLSTAASAPLGLATPLGAPGQATGLIMLALNLQPGQAIPLAQGLLSQCAALDKQAAGLFPAQDAGLHGCVAMLQEYTAALRLQAGDYAHSSHHFKWAEACAAVLASPDLQGIARTKGMLSKPLSAQEALGMWAALHAAQQERMRAADELQGALLQPSDTAMEAHADAARSALTEQLQALVGGPAEPLKQAFAAFLTAQSTTLRELQRGQGGAEVAQQAQQAVMGLVSVAVVFNKAGAGATLFDGTTQGAPEPLSWLTTAVEHLRTAASAVAKLQAEVVPQLVGFALHGPTDTMLKDVCALHSCRKEWEQAVVSAQLLARHRQEHAKLLASYDQQVAALSHAMQQADAELANAAVAETLKEGQLAGERQLAAFEWLHDADLRQAGVLPAGMNVTPKGLNWALRTRRAELLQRLQHSLAALERVEEAVARWEAASAHLETQLQAAVAAASPQLLARLQHFLSQRGQWLVWAREQAASLSRMARSVLQFEYSREGRMLVGGSQAHDSFAENGNQLQQLDLVLSALAAAEAEMPSAQARLMAVLNDSANASLALDAAQATESRAGAHFASHAPLLVQEARQLSGPLQEACEAIVDSRGSVLRDVGPMLAELRQVTKGHTQASSIQQMAAWALQHHSSLAHSLAPLQAALAGLSSALRPLDLQPYAATAAAAWGLQGKRPGREARAREQAEEEARAEKLALAQAAAVIDVLRVVVPPAERQVSVAPQAAASAEAIRGALTDLTAAASGVAAVIQQEHALEPEADTSATSTAIAATAPAASLPQAAGNPKRKPQRHSSSVQSDRQAFAAGVMRRFGTKLAGRVEEAGGAVRELSVAQQVDLLLRQATSLDLLCQMYEGWTPWI